ncbi:MAG: VanZ family protein [Tepidisphaeraceae bacterium]
MTRAARIGWGLTIVYWAGLFVVTHLPLPRLPYVPVTDKTAHVVAYALLSVALMMSLHRGGKMNPAVTVLTMLLIYGAIDEWTQIPVGRSCELADWYADAAGAAVGVVVVSWFYGSASKRASKMAASIETRMENRG